MSMAHVFFLLVIIFGVVANVMAIQAKVFASWNIWFWNIVWLVALKYTWVPLS